MGKPKEATAYLLGEDTIPRISKQTGIEEEVLTDWLLYDRGYGLQTKVVVVEISPDEKT